MKPILTTALVFLLSWLVLAIDTADAAHELDLFELEGNALDDAMVTGDDWDRVLLGDGGGSIADTGVIVDDPGTSIFARGGSKDTRDIPDWRWKNGSVPDKDDITNAYAAAYTENDELIIYVGADRYANNGDAVMSLWLFQDSVERNYDGTFEGQHFPGDILAVANFSGGGQVVEVVLYEWTGLGGKDALARVPGVITKCDPMTFTTGCAITNVNDETSPWDYTPKSGTYKVFPPVSFFEGVFNISQIALQLGFDIPCFSSFMVQSRSSTALNAQLKDFVLGSFETCKLDITKTCPSGDVNGDETAFIFNYEGTVTNSGFGTLYDVIVIDDKGTPGDTGDDITHNIGTLNAGQSAPYSGSFESSQNPPTNTAQAFGKSSATAVDRTVSSDPASDECPQVDKDPGISVTKDCQTYLDDNSGAGPVTVGVSFSGMVCNTGNIGLVNIAVYESVPNVTFTDPIATSLGKLGSMNECDGYAGYYFPSSAGTTDPGLASFSNTITIEGESRLNFGTVVSEPATGTCKLCVDPERR